MKLKLIGAAFVFLAFGLVVCSDYYTAGVVEFIPVNYNTAVIAGMKEWIKEQSNQNSLYVSPTEVNAVKMLNLHRYENFIRKAHSEQVDILVFPEDTTTGWPVGFNNGRDGALPWLEYVPPMNTQPFLDASIQSSSPAVYFVSQYANQYNITIVIDIGEVVWCNSTESMGEMTNECPSDGRWQFNTQLAFDHTGALIGKHRKLHLFLADTEIFNYPEESLDHFEAFGVSFGMLVCFDVWFSYPGFALTRELGIENFVLSSWWENNGTLPLVTAVNMQQGFAHSTKSNLLACSVGLGVMNSGSGIYNGATGEQNFNYDPHFLTRKDVLIVQELPKSPSSSASLTSKPRRRFEMEINDTHLDLQTKDAPTHSSRGYSELISLPQGAAYSVIDVKPRTNQEFSLDHGSFQCFFNISFADVEMSNSTIVMMAYSGPYFDDLLQADLCAIYRCASRSLQRPSCETLTIESDIVFDNINIIGSFSENQDVFAMASKDQGQLLQMSDIQVRRSAESASLVVSSHSPLLNIVLYAPSLTQNYY